MESYLTICGRGAAALCHSPVEDDTQASYHNIKDKL